MNNNALIPTIGVVTSIRRDTPDVKTFTVVRADTGTGVCFKHMPGQCAMLSIPGVGEAMFSITSSPTCTDHMEFSIKKCGCLTSWLHQMDVGQQVTVRGPYGNGFPVTTELKGKDLVFIAGGIGLAPLRSVIEYMLANRADYGHIDIVYGSRSKEDLVDIDIIRDVWMKAPDVDVHLTIDRPQDDWDGHVGFVPAYVTELGFDPNKTVLVCGPPIMIKFTLQSLGELGFEKTQVYTCLLYTSNIAGTVDIHAVAEAMKNVPGVVYATDYQYMCSEVGQQKIREAIAEYGLTGVVVCSCSPRMHEATFRKTAEKAGLNPYTVSYTHLDVYKRQA